MVELKMDERVRERLKKLPQVGSLLEQRALLRIADETSHDLVKFCCNRVISNLRKAIQEGNEDVPDSAEIVRLVKEEVGNFLKPRLKRVINATGILLHTGLGRAPLMDEVYKKAFERVRGACNLELDLESGRRGDRQDTLEELLTFITGAGSAAVVNNNAAAVLLALNTLAFRKETIVSRGQLIEIGGAFRLPEVMRKSGTRLVEVGTTNRTYLKDYEEAINEKTRAILVAHTSNYRVKGFVHEADFNEIAMLCQKHELFLIHDLGGGVLLDLNRWSLPPEPVASESIRLRAHVVTFSGDKVLGGPQVGIIIGEKEAIGKIRKNHLMRALRPDKVTLALLEETLKFYLSPQKLLEHHPVIARLAEKPEEAMSRAQKISKEIAKRKLSDRIQISVVPTKAQLGSGALPLEEFPSAALKIRVQGWQASKLARELRMGDPPIIGYVSQEDVFLDVKAVLDDEIHLLSTTLRILFSRIK